MNFHIFTKSICATFSGKFKKRFYVLFLYILGDMSIVLKINSLKISFSSFNFLKIGFLLERKGSVAYLLRLSVMC